MRRVKGNDTMDTVGFLKHYCDEYKPDVLVVDDTGVGGGVVDRLREVRLVRTRLLPFISGEKAKDEAHFVNRIAEVWWRMRERYIHDELDTDDDSALIGQVSSREYKFESDSRIRLQSKDKMYRSPDEADALAMTFAATQGGMKIWV